jgi:hypothetical protein
VNALRAAAGTGAGEYAQRSHFELADDLAGTQGAQQSRRVVQPHTRTTVVEAVMLDVLLFMVIDDGTSQIS